eukprot:TRINITY_DN178_c0_g1_i4.p2 TRINITY_DN178_c0_g1~~TRINITY_DN178_c0_g1_i4.p2  ORF type:complete len:119 (+),score=33.43 TRINITY_DN178_c0_g1_i4:79-435(+)
MVFAQTSSSFAQSQQRVRSLFHAIMRELPRTRRLYQIEMTEREMRSRVLTLFKRNAGVREVRQIDFLLYRAEAEFQEIQKQYKTKAGLMRYFEKDPSTSAAKKSEGDKAVQDLFNKYL